MIARPVQVALPCSMDSAGLWLLRLRPSVVVNVDALKQIAIQNLGCFTRSFAIANEFAGEPIEVAFAIHRAVHPATRMAKHR